MGWYDTIGTIIMCTILGVPCGVLITLVIMAAGIQYDDPVSSGVALPMLIITSIIMTVAFYITYEASDGTVV